MSTGDSYSYTPIELPKHVREHLGKWLFDALSLSDRRGRDIPNHEPPFPVEWYKSWNDLNPAAQEDYCRAAERVVSGVMSYFEFVRMVSGDHHVADAIGSLSETVSRM